MPAAYLQQKDLHPLRAQHSAVVPPSRHVGVNPGPGVKGRAARKAQRRGEGSYRVPQGRDVPPGYFTTHQMDGMFSSGAVTKAAPKQP